MKWTAVAVLLLVGCTAAPVATPSPAPTSTPTATPAPTLHLIGTLNPAVTQATIRSTICVPHWTDKIRPSLPTRKGYWYDHLMPLELGGAPRDPANLAYIPIARARADDVWETRLNRRVCAGTITLAEAQQWITRIKLEPRDRVRRTGG